MGRIRHDEPIPIAPSPAEPVVAADEPARIRRSRRRDSHLRRLLALADVVALAGSLCLAVVVFGSDTLEPAVALVPLLLLLGMKLLGLYDRDAPMIHKTCLLYTSDAADE